MGGAMWTQKEVEVLFTKTEMNNEWNVDFFSKESALDLRQLFKWVVYWSKHLFLYGLK